MAILQEMFTTTPEETGYTWNSDSTCAVEVVAKGTMGNFVDSLIIRKKKMVNGGNKSGKST